MPFARNRTPQPEGAHQHSHVYFQSLSRVSHRKLGNAVGEACRERLLMHCNLLSYRSSGTQHRSYILSKGTLASDYKKQKQTQEEEAKTRLEEEKEEAKAEGESGRS